MLAALQTFVTERQRELFEDTILLSDDAGLQRLYALYHFLSFFLFLFSSWT